MNDFDGRRKMNVDELNRRVLAAARQEQPTVDLSARMANEIGLSASNLFPDPTQPPAATPTEPAHPAAGAEGKQELPQATTGDSPITNLRLSITKLETESSWGGWVPWVSGAVVVVAVVGAVVGTRSPAEQRYAPGSALRDQLEQAPEDTRPIPVEPNAMSSPPTVPEVTAPAIVESGVSTQIGVPARPSVSLLRGEPRAVSDLRAEIAAVDSVRTAVQGGAFARALGLVREYEARYPNGNFWPEVTALRIEALAKSGRMSEARLLAQRFVSKYRGLPIAERVARIAELPAP